MTEILRFNKNDCIIKKLKLYMDLNRTETDLKVPKTFKKQHISLYSTLFRYLKRLSPELQKYYTDYYNLWIDRLSENPVLLDIFMKREHQWIFSGRYAVILSVIGNTHRLGYKTGVSAFVVGVSGSGKGILKPFLANKSFKRIDKVTTRGFDEAVYEDKDFFNGIHVFLDFTTTVGTQCQTVQRAILNFYNAKVDDPNFIEYSFISKKKDKDSFKGKTSFLAGITNTYLDYLKNHKELGQSTLFDRCIYLNVVRNEMEEEIRKDYKRYLKSLKLWDVSNELDFNFGSKSAEISYDFSQQINELGKWLYLGKSLKQPTTTDRSDEQITLLLQSIASLEKRDVNKSDINLLQHFMEFLTVEESLEIKIYRMITFKGEVSVEDVCCVFRPDYATTDDEKKKSAIYMKYYKILKNLKDSGFLEAKKIGKEHKLVYSIKKSIWTKELGDIQNENKM